MLAIELNKFVFIKNKYRAKKKHALELNYFKIARKKISDSISLKK